MELFGFKFERVKKEEALRQTSAHKAMGVGIETYIPLNRLIQGNQSDFTRAIVWPPRDGLSGFQQIKYDKILKDFIEKVRKREYFDVCPIHQLEEMGCFKMTPETKKIHEDLRCLHCVYYVNIPPDIIEQIPAMLTAIFTGGESLRDITNEVEVVIPHKPLLEHDHE